MALCPLARLPPTPHSPLSPTVAVATGVGAEVAAATGVEVIWIVDAAGASTMNVIASGVDPRKADGAVTETIEITIDTSTLMSDLETRERTAIRATCAIGILDPSSTVKVR